MQGGYFGQYLRVDITQKSASYVPIQQPLLHALIGGVGIGTLLLAQETPSNFDPLGPSAALVIAFGPLVGTPLTTSAKVAFVAKSPLTYRLNDALSSSSFALAGKRSGVDAIVIKGQASEPSIVLLDEGRLQIIPCPHLWGTEMPLSEISSILSKQYPDYSFCMTGVAGERLVRYAGLANDGRHAGRGGLGAVLGSKLVKAIGIRGKKKIPLAFPDRVVTLSRDLAKRSLGPATEKYRELGTVANLATFNRLAALPTRNFQQSTFDEAPAISGETLKLTREKGRGSCVNCTIGCEHFYEVTAGKAPVKAEYENLFALGPLCGIHDPNIVLAASQACDELGMDTISTGGTIAFAMECAERGLFDKTPWAAEAKGLGFGDGQRLLSLIDQIAYKRTSLGQLLAEGSRRAAELIGPPAPDFAPHVKGLEIPGYEPRALQTMALGFAVSSRGADHNRSGAYEADFSGKVDRLAATPDAARFAIETENRAAILDSLILCKFLRGTLQDFFAETADLLTSVTGIDTNAARMRQSAERIVLLKRLFNLREGWTAQEDTLPARFFDAPLPTGVAQGVQLSRKQLADMIQAYYTERGFEHDGTISHHVITNAGLDELTSFGV